ncbi:MAG: hypothetical protein H7144_05925, partial [Burkholderiales bacterium]|nr:hypothetical protein [Phycisphaerae bacterium]
TAATAATIGVDDGAILSLQNSASLTSTNIPVTVQGATGRLLIGGNVDLGTGVLTSSLNSTNASVGGLMFSPAAASSMKSVIAGSGTVITGGAGVVTFEKPNTYTGHTFALGQLKILDSAGLGDIASGTTIGNAAGQLILPGGVNTAEGFKLLSKPTGAASISHILNQAGTNTIYGNIGLYADTGTVLQIQSDAGLLTLSGNISVEDTFSPTTVRPLFLRGAGSGLVTGGFSNGVGRTALSKFDAGTWTLAGASSYYGPTMVNGGELRVSAAHTPTGGSNSTLIVNSGSFAVGSTGDATYFTVSSPTSDVTVDGVLRISPSAVTDFSTAQRFTGTGTVNVTNGTVNSAQGARVGTLSLAGGAVMNIATNGGATGVTKVDSLAIDATSKLELMDNDLVVDYGLGTTVYAAVLANVKRGLPLLGFGGDGTGITSAEVIAQGAGGIGLNGTMLAVIDGATTGGQVTSLSGFAVPNPTTSVLVKYTWRGDANLDGVVNGSDYALADTGFSGGGTGWFYGDVNYDGTVNGSDYALIDTGFSSQTGPLPEPSMLGVLGLGAIGMLRRRRAVSRG